MASEVKVENVDDSEDISEDEFDDEEECEDCISCKEPIFEDGATEIRLTYKFEGEKRNVRACSTTCAERHMTWLDNFKSICICDKCEHCQMVLVGPGCLVCGNKKKEAKFIRKNTSRADGGIIIAHYCSVPCEVKGKELLCYGCRKCHKTIKESGEKNNTLICGACRGVRYCSRKCQIADWKIHKEDCKEAVKSRKFVPPLFFDKNSQHICANCYKKSSHVLKRCSGCKQTYYCSKKCQSEHWKKDHKLVCKELVLLGKSLNKDDLKRVE